MGLNKFDLGVDIKKNGEGNTPSPVSYVNPLTKNITSTEKTGTVTNLVDQAIKSAGINTEKLKREAAYAEKQKNMTVLDHLKPGEKYLAIVDNDGDTRATEWGTLHVQSKNFANGTVVLVDKYGHTDTLEPANMSEDFATAVEKFKKDEQDGKDKFELSKHFQEMAEEGEKTVLPEDRYSFLDGVVDAIKYLKDFREGDVSYLEYLPTVAERIEGQSIFYQYYVERHSSAEYQEMYDSDPMTAINTLLHDDTLTDKQKNYYAYCMVTKAKDNESKNYILRTVAGTFQNVGESLDWLSNPIKAAAIWTDYKLHQGASNPSLLDVHGTYSDLIDKGLGDTLEACFRASWENEGRRAYNYDTGSVAFDMILETISDPEFVLGLSSKFAKAGLNSMDDIIEQAAKQFPVESREGTIKLIKDGMAYRRQYKLAESLGLLKDAKQMIDDIMLWGTGMKVLGFIVKALPASMDIAQGRMLDLVVPEQKRIQALYDAVSEMQAKYKGEFSLKNVQEFEDVFNRNLSFISDADRQAMTKLSNESYYLLIAEMARKEASRDENFTKQEVIKLLQKRNMLDTPLGMWATSAATSAEISIIKNQTAPVWTKIAQESIDGKYIDEIKEATTGWATKSKKIYAYQYNKADIADALINNDELMGVLGAADSNDTVLGNIIYALRQTQFNNHFTKGKYSEAQILSELYKHKVSIDNYRYIHDAIQNSIEFTDKEKVFIRDYLFNDVMQRKISSFDEENMTPYLARRKARGMSRAWVNGAFELQAKYDENWCTLFKNIDDPSDELSTRLGKIKAAAHDIDLGLEENVEPIYYTCTRYQNGRLKSLIIEDQIFNFPERGADLKEANKLQNYLLTVEDDLRKAHKTYAFVGFNGHGTGRDLDQCILSMLDSYRINRFKTAFANSVDVADLMRINMGMPVPSQRMYSEAESWIMHCYDYYNLTRANLGTMTPIRFGMVPPDLERMKYISNMCKNIDDTYVEFVHYEPKDGPTAEMLELIANNKHKKIRDDDRLVSYMVERQRDRSPLMTKVSEDLTTLGESMDVTTYNVDWAMGQIYKETGVFTNDGTAFRTIGNATDMHVTVREYLDLAKCEKYFTHLDDDTPSELIAATQEVADHIERISNKLRVPVADFPLLNDIYDNVIANVKTLHIEDLNPMYENYEQMRRLFLVINDGKISKNITKYDKFAISLYAYQTFRYSGITVIDEEFGNRNLKYIPELLEKNAIGDQPVVYDMFRNPSEYLYEYAFINPDEVYTGAPGAKSNFSKDIRELVDDVRTKYYQTTSMRKIQETLSANGYGDELGEYRLNAIDKYLRRTQRTIANGEYLYFDNVNGLDVIPEVVEEEVERKWDPKKFYYYVKRHYGSGKYDELNRALYTYSRGHELQRLRWVTEMSDEDLDVYINVYARGHMTIATQEFDELDMIRLRDRLIEAGYSVDDINVDGTNYTRVVGHARALKEGDKVPEIWATDDVLEYHNTAEAVLHKTKQDAKLVTSKESRRQGTMLEDTVIREHVDDVAENTYYYKHEAKPRTSLRSVWDIERADRQQIDTAAHFDSTVRDACELNLHKHSSVQAYTSGQYTNGKTQQIAYDNKFFPDMKFDYKETGYGNWFCGHIGSIESVRCESMNVSNNPIVNLYNGYAHSARTEINNADLLASIVHDTPSAKQVIANLAADGIKFNWYDNDKSGYVLCKFGFDYLGNLQITKTHDVNSRLSRVLRYDDFSKVKQILEGNAVVSCDTLDKQIRKAAILEMQQTKSMFMMSYLYTNPATWIRNWVDSTTKAVLDEDNDLGTHLQYMMEAKQIVDSYAVVYKDIEDYSLDGFLTEEVIDKYYNSHKELRLSKERFKAMFAYDKSTLSVNLIEKQTPWEQMSAMRKYAEGIKVEGNKLMKFNAKQFENCENINRLAIFLRETDQGKTNAEAFSKVARSQFDYAKSRAMSDVNTAIPFISFRLKNYGFWLNDEAWNSKAWMVGNLMGMFGRDLNEVNANFWSDEAIQWRSWIATLPKTDDYEKDPYTYNTFEDYRGSNAWTAFENGWIKINDKLYLKLGLSLVDAFTGIPSVIDDPSSNVFAPVWTLISNTWNHKIDDAVENIGKMDPEVWFTEYGYDVASLVPMYGTLAYRVMSSERNRRAGERYDLTMMERLLIHCCPDLFAMTKQYNVYSNYLGRPIGLNWYNASDEYKSTHRYVRGVSYVPTWAAKNPATYVNTWGRMRAMGFTESELQTVMSHGGGFWFTQNNEGAYELHNYQLMIGNKDTWNTLFSSLMQFGWSAFEAYTWLTECGKPMWEQFKNREHVEYKRLSGYNSLKGVGYRPMNLKKYQPKRLSDSLTSRKPDVTRSYQHKQANRQRTQDKCNVKWHKRQRDIYRDNYAKYGASRMAMNQNLKNYSNRSVTELHRTEQSLRYTQIHRHSRGFF